MIIKKRNEIVKQIKEEKKQQVELSEEKEIDLFDIDNIDFSQRQERRRGNRRRGYRRIDDRNLISRAQEEAGEIKDSAAQEGYKEGLKKAEDDIQQLKNSLIDFSQAKKQVFEYIAPDILEISINIARKIVKKEIEQNPQMILETISDVLKNISNEETRINIKVNPSQHELSKENMPMIVSSLGIDAKINIFSDDTIEEGGCIIQTSNGIVDATVETQLEIIKEAFKGI